MVTYLSSLFQLCCGEGGTLQTNIIGMCGDCLQCMDHTGFAPAHNGVHFPGQAPVALQANCPKWALHFVHFPGLTCSGSGSGSWVLHKGTDSVGCILCPSRVSSSGDHVLGECRWTVLLDHLPGPSCLVSQVYCKSTDLGVLCVSSGELISGCDPPGRCQPYRIPERFG